MWRGSIGPSGSRGTICSARLLDSDAELSDRTSGSRPAVCYVCSVKRRHFWLAGLAVAFSAISVFSKGWLSGFASNLGAGFVGSLLTVFLIDRAIEAAQQQQSARVKSVPSARLRPNLISHLTLLFDLHKASAAAAPTVGPARLDDIFSDTYYETIRHLDFSKPAPISPPASWFEFSTYSMQRFTNSLERMVDTFVAFLSPENIETLEGLQNSPIVALFTQLAFLSQLALKEGRRLPPLVLGNDGVIELMRGYVETVQARVTKFNGSPRKPFSIPDLPLWRIEVSPAIGSPRL